MKKIILVFLLVWINGLSEDKLDILDKQSKEFFKAITGLEKDYLQEQLDNIKKKMSNPIIKPKQGERISNNSNNKTINKPTLSQEEYEKNIFKHENDIARITQDFTKTKKLKDIKIKSMYTFNGRNYVSLKVENSDKDFKKDDKSSSESSFNIQGRYTNGDEILTHKIKSINTRTKTIELYKSLDNIYGYSIYISNYGISVSDLKKHVKKKTKVKKQNNIVQNKPMQQKVFKAKTKEIEKKVEKKIEKKKPIIKPEEEGKHLNLHTCLYTVTVSSLNVRNNSHLDARILRVLKKGDEFTIIERKKDWLQINTIYKKLSGDIMVVEEFDNWVQMTQENLITNDENCL